MAATIELKNSVTTTNAPSTLAQGETAWNITDKKVWVGNASSTPIQLIGAGASMTLTSLTTSSDSTIHGLTVGLGGGSQANSTALGANALAATNSAICTALGFNALNHNTTGRNTAIGFNCMNPNTTGDSNTAIGDSCLGSNTTGGANTAIGLDALLNNTTASNNTAVGYQAGYNTTGQQNTYCGGYAGLQVTTGTNNAFFGYGSGNNSGSTGTGSYNTALGSFALPQNTIASNNTAVGYQAGYSNTVGANNTAVGFQAGYSNTSGGGNVYIGVGAGNTTTIGGQQVIIGYNSIASAAGDNYEIVIGPGLTGKGATTGFISPAGGAMYQGNNSTLWAITSDQRLKKNIVDNTIGLDAITKIQVRNFEYRFPEEITELPKSSAINIQGVQLGPIAQELAQVLPDCVKTESTGVMSVDASNITWHLVNAIKELNAKITALEAKLGA